MGVRSTAATPAPQGDQDISKNPFVVWIKQTYPKTAATIINQYLSSEGPTNPDPTVEAQRVELRRGALDQVCRELVKNLKQGLPQGLVAKVAGQGHVRVSGYQTQFGFRIDLEFDFVVQMDKAGVIWIKVPQNLIKASAESAIVRMLGGDLNDKVHTELIKELDKQGPPNAKKTPGLIYSKGGTFRLDPGFAFVNMPA
jgi:hypothetical protein